MKRKQLDDQKSKDVNFLNKLIAENKIELQKVQAEIRAGKEKNLKKAKNLRTDISQLLSILKEKEILERETNKSQK